MLAIYSGWKVLKCGSIKVRKCQSVKMQKSEAI